jgi:hypothetical protein
VVTLVTLAGPMVFRAALNDTTTSFGGASR